MGKVLLAAGLTAVYLIVQGTLILRSGSVRGIGAYLGWLPHQRSKPRLGMVVFSAVMHIIPGIIVLVLLVAVGLRHRQAIARHLAADGGVLLVAALSLGVGIYAVVHPSGILRWARSAHPDVPTDDPRAAIVVRLIGAVGCLIGLYALFLIVS